jgi:hypothetical protein
MFVECRIISNLDPTYEKSTVTGARRGGAESTGDFLLPDPPERLSRSIPEVEAMLQPVPSRWPAEATARARAHG